MDDGAIDDDVLDLIKEAIGKLKNGDTDGALLVLGRTIDPKWFDRAEADGAYRMFKSDGAKCHMHDFFAKALGVQIAVHCGESA